MSKEVHFKIVENSIYSKYFVPIYFFYGEESYYIDRLISLLLQTVLDEMERNLNQTIFYGSETDVTTIIHTCLKYPMIGKKQLVLVRDMQDLKQINDLMYYIQKPLFSTILVLHYKYGKLDCIEKLIDGISKIGIVFESKKLYGDKISKFIVDYLKKKNVEIDVQTTQMIIDYIGNDLNRIVNELDKLIIALPIYKKNIDSIFFHKNIESNKEFSFFELQTALARGDVLKVNRIAWFLKKNFKNKPFVLLLSILFSFFVNLIICISEKNHSKKHLMSVLKLKWDFQVTDYLIAMKRYNFEKTKQNISLIRGIDAKAKGIENRSVTQEQLLIELLYKLLH